MRIPIDFSKEKDYTKDSQPEKCTERIAHMKFYQSWQGRALGIDNSEWFTASVPGNIQKDYAVANGFSDWQYSDGYKQFLPLENLDWEYRTSLSFEKKKGAVVESEACEQKLAEEE